jgi:CheY-like chemotaxis protein
VILLVIDDDPEDIQLFCEALAEVDSKVLCLTSATGEWALEIMRAGAVPDIVVLDINMPKLTGKETLAEIRKNRDFDAVRIFMFSTTVNPVEIEECKALGATDFFIKPSNFERLKEVIARMVTT